MRGLFDSKKKLLISNFDEQRWLLWGFNLSPFTYYGEMSTEVSKLT